MVREDFYALNHFVGMEMVTQCADVVFRIRISGYKHIAEPERLSVFFQPCSCFQCLCVFPSCKMLVAFGVDLFYVKQHQVCQPEQFFYFFVPYSSVTVKANVYFFFFQTFEKGY